MDCRALALVAMAVMALPSSAAPKAAQAGGCIDVTPGRPDTAARVIVNGQEVLAGDRMVLRYYPDRAVWKEQQVAATLRCTDGVCVVTDESTADKDCREEACWRRGNEASDFNTGEFVARMARKAGLVPTIGTVEIKAAFRTTSPITPPPPCPY